ncbi:MAG TPA: hypothetical protein VNM22_00305 [Candidatus Limnocylindrales bacterium]|nr:hypothetical protein [Candidatus Limnocylindrales bacterium]
MTKIYFVIPQTVTSGSMEGRVEQKSGLISLSVKESIQQILEAGQASPFVMVQAATSQPLTKTVINLNQVAYMEEVAL